jgi:phospholipid/cholesterol/gamma-HCH transport system ATP-binding protein
MNADKRYIDIEDLWKSYNSNTVLKGLSLQIDQGETVVILGRSGIGKSVLLRHIIGLEKPDKGSVFVEGIDLAQLCGKKLYRVIKHMGMLFQSSALFDSMTIGENTAFYLTQHGNIANGIEITRGEIKDRVAEALEMVDLAGKEKAMPSDLSGGMRKRAALARMIIYRPTILLYDEPTTGLDPITAMHINRLIVKIQNELNATSIVVTHDINSALFVGDRLALNHEGQIVSIENKEDFQKSSNPFVQSFFTAEEG